MGIPRLGRPQYRFMGVEQRAQQVLERHPPADPRWATTLPPPA
jgi:hypothetical protein